MLNKINGAKMIQLPKTEKEQRKRIFSWEKVARQATNSWLKFLDVFIGRQKRT